MSKEASGHRQARRARACGVVEGGLSREALSIGSIQGRQSYRGGGIVLRGP